MEKSFGLFFHLKSTRNYKGVGELPIYLCVTVDKVSREISTKRKWDPAKWNADAGRAEGKTEIVRSLNSYLDLLQRKVYEARQQLLHHGHQVTAENIKTIFYGQEIKTHKYMLMEVFKKHNDQMAELVGLEYAAGTFGAVSNCIPGYAHFFAMEVQGRRY
jgi:hypothetical protein